MAEPVVNHDTRRNLFLLSLGVSKNMNTVNTANQNTVIDEYKLERQRSKVRSVAGQQANSRGKLLGLLLKSAPGAESTNGRGDNDNVAPTAYGKVYPRTPRRRRSH